MLKAINPTAIKINIVVKIFIDKYFIQK